MPSITIPIQELGPILPVYVGVSPERASILTENQRTIPDPVRGLHLVDSGASVTAIDYRIIQQLGLPASGMAEIATPSTGGEGHLCPQYEVMFSITNTKGSWFHVYTLQVIEIDIAGQGIMGLIGRDILSLTNFIYNGEAGIFTLAY
jgi:hypothetical protein